jgi:hypothetical protein
LILNRGLCYECDSSFVIVPPSDIQYCVPREQPKTTDYLSKTYECDESHHRNSVYWEKKDYATVFDSWQSTRHYEDLSARRKREDSDLARYYLVAIE